MGDARQSDVLGEQQGGGSPICAETMPVLSDLIAPNEGRGHC